MATYTDSESGTPQSSAREQLSDLLINIFSRSQRLMTPTVGVIAGTLMVLVLAGLYAQSRYSLNVVNGQVEEARRALSAPGPDMPPLDEQLQAWESALASAMKARVAAPVDSEFVQAVLGAAQDTGVRFVTASAQRDMPVDVAASAHRHGPRQRAIERIEERDGRCPGRLSFRHEASRLAKLEVEAWHLRLLIRCPSTRADRAHRQAGRYHPPLLRAGGDNVELPVN